MSTYTVTEQCITTSKQTIHPQKTVLLPSTMGKPSTKLQTAVLSRTSHLFPRSTAGRAKYNSSGDQPAHSTHRNRVLVRCERSHIEFLVDAAIQPNSMLHRWKGTKQPLVAANGSPILWNTCSICSSTRSPNL
uniref:Peptide deformylase 2 n=1 Tax=Lygus hesperus TaxID=30085 RepID=A0A0A9VPF8_LYGHE